MDIDTELYKLYKEKGIKSTIEYVEELKEYHIKFSKDNRKYMRIIPIDSIFSRSLSLPKEFIYSLIKEVKDEFNHL